MAASKSLCSRLLQGFGALRLMSTTTAAPTTAAKAAWTPRSVRTGVFAKKLGMSQTWTEWGECIPVTILQVVGIRNLEEHGYVALQIGAENHPKPWKVTKPKLGQFEAVNVPAKRHVREFPVTQDAVLPIGTEITAAHFVPGQYVDVEGTTIGKGFQGGMKRHNFKGGRNSHGATKSHRTPGSIGSGGDPARVWPGKRMAGHMGTITRKQKSLQVYKVDTRWDVIHVRGSVPGHRQGILRIFDAERRPFEQPPPFPTAPKDALAPAVYTAPKEKENPMDKILFPQA